MKLIRVPYGKKDTPEHEREYRKEGRGPVGTYIDFKKAYPGMDIEIIDKINA